MAALRDGEAEALQAKVFTCDAFRIAHYLLDEQLDLLLQEHGNLTVVVVIIFHTEQAMSVVPNSSAERSRVNLLGLVGVVRQIVDGVELSIKQCTSTLVVAVQQRLPVLFPTVVVVLVHRVQLRVQVEGDVPHRADFEISAKVLVNVLPPGL